MFLCEKCNDKGLLKANEFCDCSRGITKRNEDRAKTRAARAKEREQERLRQTEATAKPKKIKNARTATRYPYGLNIGDWVECVEKYHKGAKAVLLGENGSYWRLHLMDDVPKLGVKKHTVATFKESDFKPLENEFTAKDCEMMIDLMLATKDFEGAKHYSDLKTKLLGRC